MWIGLTELVLSGERTQFRKPVRQGDSALVVTEEGQDLVEPSTDLHLRHTILAVHSSTGAIRYRRGGSYALQEDVKGPALWRTPAGELLRGQSDGASAVRAEYASLCGRHPKTVQWDYQARRKLSALGYQELRFTITGIRCEPALYITVDDIQAEGFKPGPVRPSIGDHLEWYSEIWKQLCPRGPKLEENPLVWVMHCRLEKER